MINRGHYPTLPLRVLITSRRKRGQSHQKIGKPCTLTRNRGHHCPAPKPGHNRHHRRNPPTWILTPQRSLYAKSHSHCRRASSPTTAEDPRCNSRQPGIPGHFPDNHPNYHVLGFRCDQSGPNFELWYTAQDLAMPPSASSAVSVDVSNPSLAGGEDPCEFCQGFQFAVDAFRPTGR
jgi:hypothetical protein